MYVNPSTQEKLVISATPETTEQTIPTLTSLFKFEKPLQSLLGIACLRKNIPMMEFLLDYCDVEYKNELGYTVIHLAAIKGYYREMKVLVSHGCKLYDTSSFGTELLDDCKSRECKELLLQYRKKDNMLHDLWRIGRFVDLPYDLKYLIADYVADKEVCSLLPLFERQTLGSLPIKHPFSFALFQERYSQ